MDTFIERLQSRVAAFMHAQELMDHPEFVKQAKEIAILIASHAELVFPALEAAARRSVVTPNRGGKADA